MPAEYFVAGFHIGQVQIGKHVGGCGEPPVADRVPEEQYTVWLTADKPGSVNDIGKIVEEWLEEDVVFLRVVLQISVLNDDEITGCLGYTRMQCRTLALIDLVLVIADLQIGVGCFVSKYRFLGIVAGAIIYNDHFFLHIVYEHYRLYPVEYAVNGGAFVVCRYDNG